MPTNSSRRVIPCLYTSDMRRTLEFYVDCLGFTQTGYYPIESDPIHTEVRLDDAAFIFFSEMRHFGEETSQCSGIFYIFPHDIDQFVERLRDKVEILWGPEDSPLGMRHFAIRDPNGYVLAFAERV